MIESLPTFRCNRGTRPTRMKLALALLVKTEVPIAPIYYYVGIQLYDSSKLGGIQANVLDEHPLRAIYRK